MKLMFTALAALALTASLAGVADAKMMHRHHHMMRKHHMMMRGGMMSGGMMRAGKPMGDDKYTTQGH